MKSLVGRCVVRCLLSFVTLAALLMAAAVLPTETLARGADIWASKLPSSDLSHYLQPQVVAQLPVEYRKALFATLQAPEARAEFWRAVFVEFRRTHNLDQEARQLLDLAERELTPDFFGSRRQLADDDPILSLRAQIIARLGRQAADELFNSAGPATSSLVALPAPEAGRVLWRTRIRGFAVAALSSLAPAVAAAPTADCNCNRSYSNEEGCLGDCNYHQRCGEGLGDCDSSGWGCGPFWMYGCDGICHYPAGAGACEYLDLS